MAWLAGGRLWLVGLQAAVKNGDARANFVSCVLVMALVCSIYGYWEQHVGVFLFGIRLN